MGRKDCGSGGVGCVFQLQLLKKQVSGDPRSDIVVLVVFKVRIGAVARPGNIGRNAMFSHCVQAGEGILLSIVQGNASKVPGSLHLPQRRQKVLHHNVEARCIRPNIMVNAGDGVVGEI